MKIKEIAKKIVKKMRPVDKLLVVLAVVAIIAAVIIAPKEAVLILTPDIDITVSVPQGTAGGFVDELIGVSEFKKLIAEFKNENHGISIHLAEASGEYGETSADVVIYNPLFVLPEAAATAAPAVPAGSEISNETLLFAEIMPFYYNIDRLQELGFDRPPKTRNDFIDVCKALAEKSGLGYAYSFSENIFTSILPWFYQLDIKNSNVQSEDKSFNWSSKAAVETFTFLNTLVQEKFVSHDSIYKSEAEILRDFVSGNAIMMIAPTAVIKKIEKNAALNYSISSIPTPTSYFGAPIFNLNVYNIGINENSPHKDAAALFVEFVISKRDSLAKLAYIIPGNLNETLERSQENTEKKLVLEKAMDLYEGSILINESETIADSGLFEFVMKEELDKMWQSLQTPAETAKKVKDRLLAN